MSNRLKVLLVSNLFPTPVDPTRGIFTFQLAKRLQEKCDVTIVCPLPWFPSWLTLPVFKKWAEYSNVPRKYEWDGFVVHSPKYVMIPKLSEAIHAVLMFPSLYFLARRLHKKRHFDAINTQWLYPDGVAITWVAHLLKLPHVLTALGCDANVFMKQKHKRSQIIWALKNTERTTVVSDALRQFIEDQGLDDIAIDVIPNGVDANVFYPRERIECVRQLGLEHKGKAIVFVGQLLEVKGIIYLIEAVEQLLSRGVDVVAYLVGEGSGRPYYESEIACRGLSARIRLVGNCPHSEVATWMGAADIFCLPSIREGFPNVVLEALFSGRPVVASDVGGIPEMVNSENGVLAEPGNTQALANALYEAMQKNWDPQSIVSTVRHLSWERAANQYLQSITKAINDTNKSAQ
jgi:teichuronic acid biosynthesis glycosyltransferase TuaC